MKTSERVILNDDKTCGRKAYTNLTEKCMRNVVCNALLSESIEKYSSCAFNNYSDIVVEKLYTSKLKEDFKENESVNGSQAKNYLSLHKMETISPNVTNNIHCFKYVASCRFCRKSFKILEECQSHECNSSNCDSLQITHKCQLCSMVFKRKVHLDRHLKGHNRNNCNLCDAQFTKRKELCKHMKAEHNINEPEKVFTCSFCDKTFVKKSSLNIHLKKHADGKPTCTLCGVICENENLYAEHMEDHVKNSKYECKLCGKKFARCQQYNQHMAGHEKHVCAPCNVTFPTKKLLHIHRQKNHGTKVIKNHQCEICGKCFNRPLHLAVHQRTHSGEKPVKCMHCNKEYYSKQTLAKHVKTLRHLKKVHKDGGEEVKVEKKYSCDKCGSKFYRMNSLRRHIEMSHTEGNPFKCDYCEYSTKCKANFKRHSQLHSKIKRYACELCGQAFRALATLKEHHVFIHTKNRDYLCDMCDGSFKNNSDLQRHRKTHSDDRPFKCSCIRSYKRLSHLKRHMETSKHYVDTYSKYIQTEDSLDSNSTANVKSSTLPVLSPEDTRESCEELLSLNEVDSNTASDNVCDDVELPDEDNMSSYVSNKDEYTFVSSEDIELFLDACLFDSENITAFPLTSLKEQHDVTLTDLPSKDISVPKFDAIIDQPILTFSNDVSADHIVTVALPIITFINQVPSESMSIPTVSDVVEQLINITETSSSENKLTLTKSEAFEQDETLSQESTSLVASQLSNDFEIEHLSLDSNCLFNMPSLSNPINIEQPSILQHEDSSQIILSASPAQKSLNEPHCLPILLQSSVIDSHEHFAINNNLLNSVSISNSFLCGELTPPPTDLSIEQNGSCDLFGESGDILLPYHHM